MSEALAWRFAYRSTLAVTKPSKNGTLAKVQSRFNAGMPTLMLGADQIHVLAQEHVEDRVGVVEHWERESGEGIVALLPHCVQCVVAPASRWTPAGPHLRPRRPRR